MARYSDIVTDNGTPGVPLAGVSVTVLASTGQLATLTTDAGGDLSNPVVIGALGQLAFNIPDPGDVLTLQYRYGGRLLREDEVPVGKPAAFVGPTGPANSTYITLAAMQAAAITNGTYNLASPSGSDGGVANGPFTYQAGNFTGRTDVVALNGVPLTTGALVRQNAGSVLTAPPTGSPTLSPVPTVLFRTGYSITDYGAKGSADGPTNLAAVQACLAACKQDGVPMLIPSDHFYIGPSSAGMVTLNPYRTLRGAMRAVPIVGLGGPAGSVLELSNPGGGIGMLFASGVRDCFDLWLEGLSVVGSYAGPQVVIGANDFSENVNTLRLYDFYSENSANDPANVAIRLNAIAQGTWVGSKANSYALAVNDQLMAVNGTALELRQVEFMSFNGGAAGNANIGIDIKDGVNLALEFGGMTLENVNYCFSHRSSISGGHLIKACQLSNVLTYAIYSSGMNTSLQAKFIADNYTPPGQLVDPANCEGVWIESRRGLATPAMPASGTAVRNTTGHPVNVLIYGGVIDSVNTTQTGAIPNTGSAGSLFSLPLNPGESITVTYEATSGGQAAPKPSWVWTNRGG